MSQHQYDVKKEIQRTALSSHSLSNRHNFNFDNVTILGHEGKEKKRRILEVLNILQHYVNAVNFKADTAKAKNAYATLLRN